MRAAVYARVSTERQGREQTIDSQLEALRAWAVANGHVLKREHTPGLPAGGQSDAPEIPRAPPRGVGHPLRIRPAP